MTTGPAGRQPEVLVIGGGPAGLAAALYLARFRRRVLLVEDGHSRAAHIPRSHNYPGFPDGVAGTDLLAAMRSQAARYGAQFATGRVESVTVEPEGFTVGWNGSAASPRKLVLATGVSDVAPAMPHLAQALQEGALRYCPVCDGFEVIDQSVGLLVDDGSDTQEALYLRHFTDRVTLFPVSSGVHFSEAQRHELDAAGVRRVDEPVESLRLWEGRVTVRHGARESVVDSLYGGLGLKVHSDLGQRLGAQHDDHGYLLTDRHQETTVKGLYAAGDVVKALNQIAVAVGQAAVAASAIHLALLQGR
ncbi:MAG TPA: NAD(P)/FAD-dependent oxidoreductase [Albitalea sp.]